MKKLNSTQLIIENNIALIKICREKQLNALNQVVLDELSLVLNDIKIKFHLSNSIEESIKSFSAQEKSIILCVGSLYVCGEILKLN